MGPVLKMHSRLGVVTFSDKIGLLFDEKDESIARSPVQPFGPTENLRERKMLKGADH